MKHIDLSELITSVSNIAMFAEKLSGAIPDDHTETISISLYDLHNHFSIYTRSLVYLINTLKQLELPATKNAAARCITEVNRLRDNNGTINKSIANTIVNYSQQIKVSLSDELEKYHAYIVDSHGFELINNGIEQFGFEVVNAIPKIKKDVIDAARCYAYELWTALVMHMMRVLEVGVTMLADHLNASRGTSWGNAIHNIELALNKERTAKGDKELKQWASETATYLNFVKDAFRNPTMHAEIDFTKDKAISIYDNTRFFMRQLTIRLFQLSA